MNDQKNFKSWFSDSVATVSGKPGDAPKVFYHGTNSESLDSFSHSFIGSAQDGKLFVGRGFYFTDNERTARQYGKNVISVYLKMENPLDLRDPEQILAAFSDVTPYGAVLTLKELIQECDRKKKDLPIEDTFVQEIRPGFYDVQWKIKGEWYSGMNSGVSRLELSEDPTGKKYAEREAFGPNPREFLSASYFSASQINKVIKDKGFDSAIGPASIGQIGDEYVVFDPRQVKSVNNLGAWDRESAKLMETKKRIARIQGRLS